MPDTKEWKESKVSLCVSLSEELLHDTQAPVLAEVPQPGLVANVSTLQGHLHMTQVGRAL